MKRGFASFHPAICFLYYVGVTLSMMLCKHPVFLACGVLLLIALNITQDRAKGLRRWWLGFLIIGLFFLIVNPFINHRGTHILFYFRYNPVMLEAVIQGAIMALLLLGLLILFASYNQVITADKFLFLFARLLPQWALLAMLSMRFVPLLRRRLSEIDAVQRTKGLSVATGSLNNRVKSGMQFVQILLSWSLEEAVQTADSMSARGYGIGKRSRYTPYRMRGKDWGALSYLLTLFALIVIGWRLGDGVLTLHPVLESMVLQGSAWFYLCVFILFVGFPLAVEGREWLRWTFWKRGI